MKIRPISLINNYMSDLSTNNQTKIAFLRTKTKNSTQNKTTKDRAQTTHFGLKSTPVAGRARGTKLDI